MIVIQLSDPHILAPGELLYRRFDTAEFLARAVAEINRLDPLPDVAVVTGDLVDDFNRPDEWKVASDSMKRLEDAEDIFRTAYETAINGRPGPVLIDVPRSIQLSYIELDEDWEKKFKKPEYKRLYKVSDADMKAAAELVEGDPLAVLRGFALAGGEWR